MEKQSLQAAYYLATDSKRLFQHYHFSNVAYISRLQSVKIYARCQHIRMPGDLVCTGRLSLHDQSIDFPAQDIENIDFNL